MKGNKGSLIIIIVLLIIFIPLTILGYLNRSKEEENSKHLLYYNNQIWFYDNNVLKGKYGCKVPSCTLAMSSNESDVNYGINIYTSDDINQVNYKKFAFIRDENKILLYNVYDNLVVSRYSGFKNYNNMLGSTAILMNDYNKWGVLSYSDSLENVIPFEYDFIGVTNKVIDNKLDLSHFIVLKDNKWSIIDNNNKSISSSFDDVIIDYSVNNNILVIVFKNSINIYNISNNRLYESISFNGSFKNIDIDYSNNIANIKLDGNTIKSIEINN